MGKKGGTTAGLESGVAEVKSFTAGQGVEITSGSQRPKPVKGGSVAAS